MTGNNTAVFGVYPACERAEEAIGLLISSGFTHERISVLLPTSDVTAGCRFGPALGSLAGLGALAVPGAGAFVAAGPLKGTLAGLGAGRGDRGLVSVLTRMGIPEYEAKLYDELMRNGGVLLSVACGPSPEIDSAKEILKTSGAEGIASVTETSASSHETSSDLSEVA